MRNAFHDKSGKDVFCNGRKSRRNFPVRESGEWNINV